MTEKNSLANFTVRETNNAHRGQVHASLLKKPGRFIPAESLCAQYDDPPINADVWIPP